MAGCIVSLLLVACGDGESVPPAPPTPADTPAPSDGGLSGTLIWAGAPYLHTGDLSADAVSTGDLEGLGQAGVGPEEVPVDVYRRGEAAWELLSEGAAGWLVWEPLAVVEARRQLAGRLGVEPVEVEVRDVEDVDWPNSCLGAPEPNEVCAEVITAGFRITLAAGGDEYEYHSDRGGHVRAAP